MKRWRTAVKSTKPKETLNPLVFEPGLWNLIWERFTNGLVPDAGTYEWLFQLSPLLCLSELLPVCEHVEFSFCCAEKVERNNCLTACGCRKPAVITWQIIQFRCCYCRSVFTAVQKNNRPHSLHPVYSLASYHQLHILITIMMHYVLKWDFLDPKTSQTVFFFYRNLESVNNLY